MSRTINVTGGYTDYAVATLTERTGQDLSTTTIKAALFPRTVTLETLPAATDPAWKTPNVVTYPKPGQAVLSLLVDATIEPGAYSLWALPADSPTVVPVQATNTPITVI